MSKVNSNTGLRFCVAGDEKLTIDEDGVAVQSIAVGHLTTDKTINTSDATFTDLFTVSTSGTEFIVHAVASGLSDGAMTPRLRVLVDGSAANYAAMYGPAAAGAGEGVQMSLLYHVSGLSPGNHDFKLQSCYGGSTGWTIHAGTNPTREGAAMTVTRLA